MKLYVCLSLFIFRCSYSVIKRGCFIQIAYRSICYRFWPFIRYYSTRLLRLQQLALYLLSGVYGQHLSGLRTRILSMYSRSHRSPDQGLRAVLSATRREPTVPVCLLRHLLIYARDYLFSLELASAHSIIANYRYNKFCFNRTVIVHPTHRIVYWFILSIVFLYKFSDLHSTGMHRLMTYRTCSQSPALHATTTTATVTSSKSAER